MPATSVTPDLDNPLSRNNALPGQHYHPDEVNDLANEQLGRGTDYYSSHLNYGVGDTGLIGGSDDPMLKALQGNYDSQVDDNTMGLKRRAEAKAPVMKAEADAKASSELSQTYQKEQQNFAEQYAFQLKRKAMYNQWVLAKKKAETDLLGAIFGGIGSVAGAVLGGGKK